MKAIYNPSGRAGEYSYWAANFYTGCSNDCQYCYCKRGVLSSTWSTEPKLKSCFKNEDHALEVFRKELTQNLAELREHGIFFSFTTDPMLENTICLTMEALGVCITNGVPVKILTKRAGFTGAFRQSAFEYCFTPEYKSLIAFGFTLTGHDELEQNASTNAERIEAMRKLHEAGFKTFASIEPIIDIESSLDMIEDTLGFCDLYKIGLKSGKKYDKNELQRLIGTVCSYTLHSTSKIYFKDSLLEQAGINRSDLPTNCVGRDHNLFKA